MRGKRAEGDTDEARHCAQPDEQIRWQFDIRHSMHLPGLCRVATLPRCIVRPSIKRECGHVIESRHTILPVCAPALRTPAQTRSRCGSDIEVQDSRRSSDLLAQTG